MLKTTQILGLHQKLSPQMIQSQLLLAVPTLVLDNEIKLQLEANPMLEESETTEQEEQQQETETAAEQEKTEQENEEDSYGIEEWFEYSEQGTEGYKSPDVYYKEKSQTDKPDFEVLTDERLRETPLEQLHRSGLEEKLIIIGEEIIGSLDDDGYLRDNPAEIINDIKKQSGIEVSAEEFEHVLKIIQKLDPIGTGSRNLQECLTVQIEELKLDEETKNLCIELVNNFFDDFKLKRYERISGTLKINLEKVKELFDIIHKLNPVPGNLDNITERNYVYPDFIVKKIDDEFVVELNDDFVPALRINRKYLELLKQKKTPKQTKEFIKNKLDSAKWFISSIHSRKETMLKVMRAIMNRQREFFETNGEALKPMYEKDIAEDINMDLSTVSRTIRNKYVQTDFGMFELKHFFSHAVHINGDDVSSRLIKEKIKDLIGKEDKSRPMTDDKIAEIISEEGFSLARRTIAKYRESMKIPKAALRRQIVI